MSAATDEWVRGRQVNAYMQCPKCGYANEHGLRYVRSRRREGTQPAFHPWQLGCTPEHPEGEHLHVECGICTYPSFTLCADNGDR